MNKRGKEASRDRDHRELARAGSLPPNVRTLGLSGSEAANKSLFAVQ
jgi:hypothetical protein